jgi:sugar phosphate isomerase/epimerase
MKLSVITDEIDADLDNALNVMAEYGVTGAEIRSVWNGNIADASDDMVEKVRRTLADHGATCVAIASPFYKCDMGEDLTQHARDAFGPPDRATACGFSDQIAMLERCVEIARRLDTKYIRVFTFWKKEPLTSEIEDQLVSAFLEPAQIAERAGVTLLIENEHSCCVGTGAQSARLLEDIGSPAVRGLWDPGNAYFDGETPFPTGYDAIKRYIEHVHVKDAHIVDGRPQWCIVGEGDVRWPDQLKALKNDGYAGYLSLETHYNAPPSKEATSRECIKALARMVAQA